MLVAYAERTTTQPLVPLGWGLRAAGHEVLVATQPAAAAQVAATGLPVAAVGRDHGFWRVMRHVGFERDTDVPGFASVLGRARSAAPPDERLRADYAEVVTWWWRTVNDPMLDAVVRLARRWRPDVVVWETSTYAGAVAAAACGAAHARFVWTVDVFARLRARVHAAEPGPDALREWLERCARRYGVAWAEELAVGQATITFLPAALRGPSSVPSSAPTSGSGAVLPVRPVPFPGRSVLPRWLTERPRRPRVVVCFGTTGAEHFGTDGAHLGDVVRGLGGLGADVVVATAAPETLDGVDLPDGVRVEPFLPLDALMRSCSLLVSHGGPGTVTTGVAHGVPQLVVPGEFDSPELAAHLAATGAAAVLERAAASPAAVTAAADGLLRSGTAAAAARRLQDEARAMPGPAELAAPLGALCR
nr:nucleotide disphospho-sugar-binding domain-containing protein [Nocardioides zeae]